MSATIVAQHLLSCAHARAKCIGHNSTSTAAKVGAETQLADDEVDQVRLRQAQSGREDSTGAVGWEVEGGNSAGGACQGECICGCLRRDPDLHGKGCSTSLQQQQM